MKRDVVTRGSESACQPRSGFVLAVITIAIVLLSLAAYNYSGTMLVEHEATAMGGRDVTARTAAESAIEFAATRILERDYDDTIDLYNDPDVFRAQLLLDSSVDRGRVRYTIVAPDETNTSTGSIRFGLGNENAKFNINRLLELDALESALPAEEQLGLVYLATSSIPNMTDDIIDAILDWLDSDEDRRPGGAESNEYEGLSVPYPCKNGPMDSIDELLKESRRTCSMARTRTTTEFWTPTRTTANKRPPLTMLMAFWIWVGKIT
jgi:type II secretory pathway component PulK